MNVYFRLSPGEIFFTFVFLKYAAGLGWCQNPLPGGLSAAPAGLLRLRLLAGGCYGAGRIGRLVASGWWVLGMSRLPTLMWTGHWAMGFDTAPRAKGAG